MDIHQSLHVVSFMNMKQELAEFEQSVQLKLKDWFFQIRHLAWTLLSNSIFVYKSVLKITYLGTETAV